MVHEFLIHHLLGTAALLLLTVVFLYRAKKATRMAAPGTSEAFWWNRFQHVVGVSAAVFLALGVSLLPYWYSPAQVKSSFDVVMLLAINAGCLWGIAEILNRRVLINASSISGVTWSGRLKQVSWPQVTSVSFHNFYGGFFLVRSGGEWIFVPVQVERPLQLIAALERNAPAAALATARRGIALCRAVFEPER